MHDSIRGREGACKRVFKSIDIFCNLKKEFTNKFEIGVVCTISSKNIKDIPGLVKLLNKNEYIDYIDLNVVSQTFNTNPVKDWQKDPRYSHIWPKNRKVNEKVYTELISLKNQGYKISNSERQLKIHKEFLLNPNIEVKQTKCNIYKSLRVDVTGTLFINRQINK